MTKKVKDKTIKNVRHFQKHELNSIVFINPNLFILAFPQENAAHMIIHKKTHLCSEIHVIYQRGKFLIRKYDCDILAMSMANVEQISKSKRKEVET